MTGTEPNGEEIKGSRKPPPGSGWKEPREIFKKPLRKLKRPVPLDEQVHNVLQLLRDRGSDMITGPSIKNFADKGEEGVKLGFSAEYVRRFFGTPADPKNPDSEYVEHLRGASHMVLEVRLAWMKENARPLWRALNAVFPRDEGGDRDYEILQRRAALSSETEVAEFYLERVRALGRGNEEKSKEDRKKERVLARAARMATARRFGLKTSEVARALGPDKLNVADLRREARELDALVEWGIQVLAMRCQYDELFVVFFRARDVKEEELRRTRNRRIVDLYLSELESGRSKSGARARIRSEYGISDGRIYQILAEVEEERGAERRRPGRPRKGN